MKSSKPSWKEIIAFAIGDGGCNLVWTTIGSYLTLYYTDSVGLATAFIGTMMLLTRLLDGVSDLIMGSILDRTHTRWGKARPWILWTAIPMGLGLVIVFTIPSGLSQGGKMAWATITYILMAVVIYTACNLAYNTLLSLEAPDPKDRVLMSSIRFFLTMGTVLFINYNVNGLVEKFGWTGMAVIFGILACNKKNQKSVDFLKISGIIAFVDCGVWRSLVARTAGGREVAGSNPVAPTRIFLLELI